MAPPSQPSNHDNDHDHDNDNENEQQGSTNVSFAYETISQWTWQAKLGAVVAIYILIMMLSNIMFTDYTAQTKQYFSSIGREDLTREVVPPTTKDIRMAAYQREVLIRELSTNMTIVMSEVRNLRVEVEKLKHSSLT